MLINDTIKMANARVAQIKITGGYCEIKNPARRAIAIKNIKRRCVRKVFV